jgi:PAS domain S-box-containing protein
MSAETNNRIYFTGNNEMARLINSKDWSQTTLGPIDGWPQSLRTTLSLMLNTRFPMLLYWGPDLISFYNDAFIPSLGTDGRHPLILGMPASEAWHEIWDYIKPLLDEVLSGKSSVWSRDQLVPILRNGKMEDVYWTYTYNPVNDESSNIAGVLILCAETTSEVLARRQLDENRQQLQFAIDAADLGTWDLNPITNRFTCNERMRSWFGFEPADDIELTKGLNCVVPTDLPKVLKALEWVLGPQSDGLLELDFSIVNPVDNEFRRVLAKGKVLYSTDKVAQRFSGTLQDITQQYLSRQKLEESEARLSMIVDASELGTWELDVVSQQVYCSDKCLTILGQNSSNPTRAELLQNIHPEDLKIRELAFLHGLNTGQLRYEVRFIHPDGNIHWVENRGRLLYDEAGTPVKMIGTVRDITEQKSFAQELERKVLQRTAELERMNAELKSFAYIASHDLQEPLRKIQTFISRIVEREADNLSPAGKDSFSRVQNAANRMQKLIEDLLTYSRTNTTERKFEEVEVEKLIEEVRSEMREDFIQSNGALDVEVTGTIKVVAFQFKQVLQNLISNSLKFSKPDVAPVIEIRGGVVNTANIPFAVSPETRFYHLSITDNSIGFEQQYSERIFELFQRLHGKDEYKGTGIGLAIVKKIVESHGGYIAATSTAGNGARFDIYIPV